MSRDRYPSGDGGYTDDPSYWLSTIDRTPPPMFGGAMPGWNAPSPEEVAAKERYEKSFDTGAVNANVYDFGKWVEELSPCFKLSNSQWSDFGFVVNDDGSVDVTQGKYQLLMRFPKNTQMSMVNDHGSMKMRFYAAGSYPYNDTFTIPFILTDCGEKIHGLEREYQPRDIEEDNIFAALNKAGLDDEDINEAVTVALEKKWLKHNYKVWVSECFGHKPDEKKEKQVKDILSFIRQKLWYNYMTIEDMANVLSSLPEGMEMVNDLGAMKMKLTDDGKFVSITTEGGIKSSILNYQFKQKTRYPLVYGKPTEQDKNPDKDWGVLIPSKTIVVWTGYKIVVVENNEPFIRIEAMANVLGKNVNFNAKYPFF